MTMTRASQSILGALALVALVLVCAGFTIGLTFAPCYSSMCVEKYFPYETRVHIGVFYGLVSSFILALLTQRFIRPISQVLDRPISSTLIFGRIPPTTIGRILLLFWIFAVALVTTTYWFPEEDIYWRGRGDQARGWETHITRVVWTGVTGHWVDIWIGLTILPVGRNTLIANTFRAQSHTLLWAHKMLGYMTLIGGIIHGLLYYSFLGAWVDEGNTNYLVSISFAPDNPALTEAESDETHGYAWLNLIGGGLVGIILIPATTVVALPWLRRAHYNVFYFTHAILAVLILVLVCVHASTNFYFILPGLLLWIYDWACRLRNSLSQNALVSLEDAGNGWYRLRLPQDAKFRDMASAIDEPKLASEGAKSELQPSDTESGPTLAPTSFSHNDPLETWYVNIKQISKLEIHPFTMVSDSEDGSYALLFRKSPERKKAAKRDREWTWKLAMLFEAQETKSAITLQARLEGPYTPQISPLRTADHTLAIVGGSGVTGAISLLNWWFEQYCGGVGTDPKTKSFCLVWSVRDESQVELAEIERVREKVNRAGGNISLRIHNSKEAGRLSAQGKLERWVGAEDGRRGKAWVYASGPAGLLQDVEIACDGIRRGLRRGEMETGVEWVDYYIASYAL